MFLYSGVNQHFVLKEVADGETPNRDAGNAISQRQASVGGFVGMEAKSPKEGTSVKLYVYDIEPYAPGNATPPTTREPRPAANDEGAPPPPAMSIAFPFSRSVP